MPYYQDPVPCYQYQGPGAIHPVPRTRCHPSSTQDPVPGGPVPGQEVQYPARQVHIRPGRSIYGIELNMA